MKGYQLTHILLKEDYQTKKYCIDYEDGLWMIYYSERGSQSAKRTFAGEEEACEEFYLWLTSSLRRMKLIDN